VSAYLIERSGSLLPDTRNIAGWLIGDIIEHCLNALRIVKKEQLATLDHHKGKDAAWSLMLLMLHIFSVLSLRVVMHEFARWRR